MTAMAPRRRKTVAVVPAPKARTNKPVRPSLDPHGIYAAACLDLAADLGWPTREIWDTWRTFVSLRMDRQRLPQSAAEESAWRDVKASFDKRDTQGDAS